MSLIEGVGDEVTVFFIIAWVVFIGWIAWCSTNISEQPLIRTVLILQHRTRSRIAELRANNQTISTITTIVGSPDGSTLRRLSLQEPTSEETVETNNADNNTNQACSTNQENALPRVPSDDTSPVQATATSPTTTTTPPEEAIIEAMDSLNQDTNLLDRSEKIPKPNSPTTAQLSESSNDNYSQLNTSESSSPIDTIDGNNSNDDNEMTIKLKFINDDQKIVSARPKEMLGNFIKRNFQVELNAQKRVRLVFNGHVLQPDSDTLEQCGLYDNCVVHCLVHQQRIQANNNNNTTGTSQASNNDSTSSIYTSPQGFQNIQTGNGISTVHNEWDLGRLLVSVLTLILAFAWYSRYHYAQLFTVTTSLALYVLTAIFTLSVVGHFFPDQDSLRNIE